MMAMLVLLCRLKSGKEEETGFFLKELGGPLIKLLEAGYDVEVRFLVLEGRLPINRVQSWPPQCHSPLLMGPVHDRPYVNDCA